MTRVLTADATPPKWQSGIPLTVSKITLNSVLLTWIVPQDDVGVSSYSLFENNMLIAKFTARLSEYNITGLAPGTAYVFRLEATDPAGNTSSGGPMLSVTTLTSPLPWPYLYWTIAGAGAVVVVVLLTLGRKKYSPRLFRSMKSKK
jgi:hypothetical protein